MIAKATPKGKSFKGIINYVYNGRLENRGLDEKNAKIIIASDNIELPYSKDDRDGIERLILSFENQAHTHKNYDYENAYVGHHILSFSKEDIKLLSEENIGNICKQYLKDSGLDNTQYVVLSHDDTDIFHAHIIFNRCNNDLKIYDDWKEKIKSAEKAVAINLKFGLPLSGKQKEMAKSSSVWEIRIQHDDIIELSQNPLLKDIKNLHHLKKVYENANIGFEETAETVKIKGESFRKTDLEAVFFKNRRQAKEKSGEKIKREYYKKPFEKNRISKDFKIKKEKSLNLPLDNKDNRLKPKSVVSQQEDENKQNLGGKNAWGDDDEFLGTKKRKRF